MIPLPPYFDPPAVVVSFMATCAVLLIFGLLVLCGALLWAAFLAVGWPLVIGIAGFCFCWGVMHWLVLGKQL